MNTFSEILQSSYPDFELLRPSAVRYLPHSVECSSRWQTYGSSSGWSTDITASARGEHFERKHFYLDIPVHGSGLLTDGLSSLESSDFINAFLQTSVTTSKKKIRSHIFDRTAVYRIVDFSTCQIPTVCLSITSCENPSDNFFYPIRDTCGCSAHSNLENAILGALKENIERQFLLRFWLSGQLSRRINRQEAHAVLERRPSLTLLSELSNSGEILVLDLTDPCFPGTCILLCYGNPHAQAKVRYCAGMAYSDNATNALEKAILELWQTFRYMQSIHSSSPEPHDPYLKHFLACNRYETFQEIARGESYTEGELFAKNQQPFGTQALLQALRTQELNGYIYLAQQITSQTKIYFCKFISPNLFLHMNNSQNFNAENRYSDLFKHPIISDRLAKMVPFP